jgi:signal transduction histidine kinase
MNNPHIPTHVLVVDDEKAIRTTFSAFLKREGYRVTECSSLAGTSAIIENTEIDVAVLDVDLGTDNGLDIADILKKKNRNIQLVMVTGHPEINDTLSLVKTVLRHDGITLAVNVPDDLPPVRCRSQQIQQVIMNLITNARDALKDGTQADEKRMITITSRLYRKNAHAFLRTAISDTGPGIPDDVRIRMFEPFYTTKSRSMGTGLGLSICHNIISEHGGTIETESVKGQGATFSFDLPLDDD